jgi:hypothetical protein
LEENPFSVSNQTCKSNARSFQQKDGFRIKSALVSVLLIFFHRDRQGRKDRCYQSQNVIMGSWNKRNVMIILVGSNWLVYQLTTTLSLMIPSVQISPTELPDASFLVMNLPFRSQRQKQSNHSAALCGFAKDEELYFDEWVDYHLGLGFESVIVYDNSDEFYLQGWNEKRPGRNIIIKHLPGTYQQRNAYNDFVYNHTQNKHTWTGFFDVDEFLVLKKHNHVVTFLHEHCQNGSVAINWFIFTMSNQTVYEPLPVTKRFQFRTEAHINTKVIVKTQDFRGSRNPHSCSVRKGTYQHDTSGNLITTQTGASNHAKPMDVAALHHYRYKSMKE